MSLEVRRLSLDTTVALCKENCLLRSTSKGTGYMSCQLSDGDLSLMRMCEGMTRIIVHARRLKCDNFNVKGLPASHIMCLGCDLYALETIHHVVYELFSLSRHQVANV